MTKSKLKSLPNHKTTEKTAKTPQRQSLTLETLELRVLLSTLIDIDPSSNLKRATSIDLGQEDSIVIESTIESSRDKDAYSFIARETGLMTITMESIAAEGQANWLDPVISIYDSRRHKITANDDAYPGTLNAAAEFYVEAGQLYYILADGLRTSWGDYSLTLTSPQQQSPAFESVDYPDSIRTALDITSNFTQEGSLIISGGISSTRDADYFTCTLAQAGEYTISLTARDSLLDTYLYLYNENGRLIGYNDDASWPQTDSELVINAAAGEKIFIRADAWRTSTGTYELSVVLNEIDNDNTDADNDELTDDSDDNGSSNDSIPDSDDGQAEGYLLIISASDYSGTVNDLAGPVTDSQIIQQVYTQTYGFAQENIHVLSGGVSTLTSEAVAAEFQWLASEADGNDYVVIYYSGHGTAGQRESRNDNEGLYLPDENIIYQEDLSRWISQIDSDAAKLVILDCCYSGGLVDLAEQVSNTQVIASCGYNQTAWDEVAQFSPINSPFNGGGVFANWFGYGILYGLADTNNNGIVSIAEAFTYADRNINQATGRGYYNQNPVMNSGINLDYEILLG